MSKSTDNATTDDSTDKVPADVEADKARLADVRNQIEAARVILDKAMSKRDQSITDAERVCSERYSAARQAMQDELGDLTEGYELLKTEITDRYSNELTSLEEARAVAVSSANAEFESTRESTRSPFMAT
ncbi:MAG TPA: hypothetical protein VGX21_13155 [Methylomirabilota bacterium]|jgi:septal ring factor EnvC (AmiA/AmiB activator)|nr:hypothetical protein [Methylomirabilota bacterium]